MRKTTKRAREAAASLLQPPNGDQRKLLLTILDPFVTDGIWPVRDYVEAMLDEQSLDASALLNTFPSWHTHYSAIWPGPGTLLRNEEVVALTVAGLALCGPFLQDAQDVVDAHLASLRYLADRLRSAPASPTAARRVEVTSDDIARSLTDDGLISSDGILSLRLAQLYSIWDHEPSGWRTSASVKDPADWTVQLGRGIRAYAGVTTVEEYLERLAEPLFPQPTVGARAHPSSLSVVEAIDYLDTVWRLHFREPLINLPGATKTASLSLPCATSDEFVARLSALADLLDRMTPPDLKQPSRDRKPKSLGQLDDFLAQQLADDSQQRATKAVATLREINNLRRGHQHHGAQGDGFNAAETLGITPLLGNWGSAWERIQVRIVDALNAIREEIQALERRE